MTASRDGDVARALILHRFASAQGIEPLGAGEWSAAYAFRDGETEYVARFGALREDFDKDHLASGYAVPPLPIPRVVEVGEVAGGYYAISERAHGDYLDGLDEAEMRRVLPSLLASLDAARAVEVRGRGWGLWDGVGVAPHGSWQDALLAAGDDHAGLRTYGWRALLEASSAGAGQFDEAYEALRNLVPAVAPLVERHLVHSDLLNRNVLVQEGRVTAVLDWGSSIYGDFLYDIAWLAFWSPWYPAWAGIDFVEEARRHYATIALDVPAFAERLRCCGIHIGLDGQAYNAFRERWKDVRAIAARTLRVAADGL